MPFIGVPFDQIDKPVDAGTYIAEVFSANTKAAKTDGSTYIEWTFVILDEGAAKGRKVIYRSFLADQKDAEAQRKAHYYLQQFLRAIKCPHSDQGFNLEDAFGKKAVIKVESEMYEGKPYPKIVEVLALPEAA